MECKKEVKGAKAEPNDGTQTIVRAIRALKLVARQPGQGIRVTDLAQTLQLSSPTAHRLLKSLSNEGMLRRDAASRRYHLGPLVFELGLASASQFNLRSACLPILEQLSRESGDTSFLFVRSGNEAVCIQRVLGTFPIQTPVLSVGSRQPLGISAGGLVLLACLPDDELEEVFTRIEPQLASYSGLQVKEVRSLVMQAKKNGYAWISHRAISGISALGLPVPCDKGGCAVAVTVATTHMRMNEERVNEVLPFLKSAAQRLASLMY